MKSKLPLIALCGTAGALAGMVALGTATAGQGIAVATLSLPAPFPYEASLAATQAASTQDAAQAPTQVAQVAQVVPVRAQVVTVATDPGLLVQTVAATVAPPADAPSRPAPAAAPAPQMAQAGPGPELRPEPPRPDASGRMDAEARPFPPPGFPPPGFPPPGFPPHGAFPPPPSPMQVASMLAAQEIALGIRADQIDLWRAFASAVVDMVKADGPPPLPPKMNEPFGLSQAIAGRAVDAGAKAKAVLEARTALIAKLTPAQVERARGLDLPPPPPPPPGGAMDGPPPFAPPRP